MKLIALFALIAVVLSAIDEFLRDDPRGWKLIILLVIAVPATVNITVDFFHMAFYSQKSMWKRFKKSSCQLFLGEYFENQQDGLKLYGKSIYCNPFCNEATRCYHNEIIVPSSMNHYDEALGFSNWDSFDDINYNFEKKTEHLEIFIKMLEYKFRNLSRSEKSSVYKKIALNE